MQTALLVAAVPTLIGAPLIELWRRRTVRAYNIEQWCAKRRAELREALEGEYQPELDTGREAA